MAKKFYAVKKGRNTGIFTTWEECKASVSRYSGAQYKSFPTLEEAREYLEGSQGPSPGGSDQEEDSCTAYVDGSFEESLGKYSFGCVLLTPEGEIVERCGSGSEPESLAIRNVAGEMLGAMYAVQWGINKRYSSIKICYDYMGIEKWAVGAWKTNNALTQKYAEFMKGRQSFIKISFQKVKAHSGNRYNEQADWLAKQALTEREGIPEIR